MRVARRHRSRRRRQLLPGGELRASRTTAALAAVACLVAAGFLAGQRTDERKLEDARELLASGRAAEARSAALEAGRGPVLGRAAVVAARAAGQLGDLDEARTELRRAVRRRPNDWAVRRDLARVLLAQGDRDGARQQAERALELNPRVSLGPQFRFAPPTE